MKNLGIIGKFKKIAAIAGVAAIAASGASIAQTPSVTAGPQYFQTISAADVASILKELSITTQLRRDGGLPGSASAAPILMASTPGGGKFLVIFQQCANAATASGCRQTTISTAQAGTNLAFDDLNRFNGGSSVTTAVYDSTNQLLIFGRNIFVPGGIGRENYKLQMLLFLNDMARFSNARSGSAKSVAFRPAPALAQRLTDAGVHELAHESVHTALEMEVALANAAGVTFDVDQK